MIQYLTRTSACIQRVGLSDSRKGRNVSRRCLYGHGRLQTSSQRRRSENVRQQRVVVVVIVTRDEELL